MPTRGAVLPRGNMAGGRMRRHGVRATGFSLIELIIGAAMLSIAVVALLGAFLGQATLNEHARNMTLAINDATRVLERLRELNSGGACGNPTVVPPADCGGACTSWNAWLNSATGGGKSVQPDPVTQERIVVTCQDSATLAYCGSTDQVGAAEWQAPGGNTNFDPLRIAVAVCWRHRGRVIGECTWDAAAQTLTPTDTDGNGVIDSPAMLSTVMTCR